MIRALRSVMGALRAARPSADEARATAAVVAEIARRDPDAAFADATFPAHLAHWWPVHARVTALDWTALDLFFGTFRPPDSAQPMALLGRRLLRPLITSGHGWVHVGDANAARRSLDLVEAGVALLYRLPEGGRDHEDDPLARHRRLVFDGPAPAIGALLPATRQHVGLPEVGDERRAGAGQGGEPRRVAIVSPPARPKGVLVKATALIHDLAQAAESDGGNSWLWTGPSQLTRFALGRLPADHRAVAVRLIDSEHHRDLESALRFQVNGVSVPHRFEAFGQTAGRCHVVVPSTAADALVLGVAYRHLAEVEHRTIGLCVEAIEIGDAP